MTVTINGTTGITSVNGTAAAPSVTGADTDTGIVYGTNTLSLATGGTTAVTVNSSQNVGIGTSSPGGRLDVAGGFARFQSSAGYVSFGDNGYIRTDSAGFLQLQSGSTGIRFMNDANDAERARIDSSGNLLVGTTTAGGKIAVYSSTAVDNIKSDSGSAAGTGWTHFNGTSSNNGTQNIKIYGNGNIQNANNSYGSLSDEKLKENIVDATPKLEKLNQVRVVNFNLKGDYEQHKQIGVIAQELEQIFPGMVEETPDRDAEGNDLGTTTKSVKYSVFVPMLVKAIQELKAIVDAQGAEIAALKGTQP